MKLLIAVAGVILTMAAPAAAAPVVLLCKGSGVSVTSDMKDDLSWEHDRTPFNFSFEVLVDFETNTVRKDGKDMFVWELTEEKLKFSPHKDRAMIRLLNDGGYWYEISRRTGSLRTHNGSGLCERAAERPPLF